MRLFTQRNTLEHPQRDLGKRKKNEWMSFHCNCHIFATDISSKWNIEKEQIQIPKVHSPLKAKFHKSQKFLFLVCWKCLTDSFILFFRWRSVRPYSYVKINKCWFSGKHPFAYCSFDYCHFAFDNLPTMTICLLPFRLLWWFANYPFNK